MLAPAPQTSIYAAVVRVAMWMVTLLSVIIAGIGGLADIFRSEGALARSGALGGLVMPEALSASPLLTEISAFQAVAGFEQIAQGHLDVWWLRPAMHDKDLARAGRRGRAGDASQRGSADGARAGGGLFARLSLAKRCARPVA